MQSILIAEDSERISSFISKGLSAHGFGVTVVSDGKECLKLLTAVDFDLLVLDIGLPTMDGFQVLETIRGSGNEIPVIVLTARDSVDDTVASFQGGADDYMSKPFSFDELLVRVRRRLRTETASTPQESLLKHEGIELDLMSRRVRANGQEHELTAREFSILELFLRNPNQLLSREQILSRVWGYDHDPASNVVDVYIRYLRQKLGGDSIRTVRGMGYRLG